MKQNAKKYTKPLTEVIPLKEPLMEETLGGSAGTYDQFAKENGFGDSDDLGKYFHFRDPWE